MPTPYLLSRRHGLQVQQYRCRFIVVGFHLPTVRQCQNYSRRMPRKSFSCRTPTRCAVAFLTFTPLVFYCAQCAQCAQSVKRLVLQWFTWAHLTQNRGISIVPTVPNFAPVRMRLIWLNAPWRKVFSRYCGVGTVGHISACRLGCKQAFKIKHSSSNSGGVM